MQMTTGPHDPCYQAALEFLYSRLNYERMDQMPYGGAELKLDRMRELLRRLGDPHHHGHVVHVAGTKGKGSTANFVSSIVSAAGYRAGCYTSPHLLTLEERFAVDGQACSRAELVQCVDRLRPIVAKMDRLTDSGGGCGLTFFELTTAIAWCYFQQRQTEVTVIEVGLGGRLDSTNVCRPKVCVITSISFDHMRQLGHTLAAIAGEKAGIIKHQVPVVTGVTQAEPYQVIERIARSHQAPLFSLDRDFTYQYHAASPHDPRSAAAFDLFRVVHGQRQLIAEDIALGALGQHQAANASLAWAACDRLCEHGLQLPDEARRAGIAASHCPARIEVVRRQPTVLIDTAHNAASIQALVRVLQESFHERQRTLILAASRDKDVTGMLHLLVPEFERIICTPYLKNPRSMSADELVRHARRIATAEGAVVDIVAVDGPLAAWQLAAARATTDSLVCATGSFFLAAEMKEIVAADS